VLVVHAETVSSYTEDVQALLNETGTFSKVDLFDAYTATPTLSTLKAYEAVLVFADDVFADAAALGDNLADFFDGGGNVVLAAFANCQYARLQGRWSSGGYDVITPGNQTFTAESQPITILDPASVLVAGVTSLTAAVGYNSDGTVSAPDVVVAKWGSGAPLITCGIRKGRPIVALNFFPPSSRARSDLWDIATSGAAIMRNALLQ
jgi:hypothetical protein